MLVVFKKKTDYNTRVAEIDNKVSSLDGKGIKYDYCVHLCVLISVLN